MVLKIEYLSGLHEATNYMCMVYENSRVLTQIIQHNQKKGQLQLKSIWAAHRNMFSCSRILTLKFVYQDGKGYLEYDTKSPEYSCDTT